MAGSFDGDHAGTDRVLGMADFFEQPAFQRSFDPLKHLSAKAIRMLFHRFHIHLELPDIHLFVRLSETVPAVRNQSETSPAALILFEDLVDLAQGRWIPFFVDDPSILDLDGRPVLFDLFDEHPDSLKDIQRFKAGDHRGSSELSCDELIGMCPKDCAHMAGKDQAIDLHLLCLQERDEGRRDPLLAVQEKEIP